MQRSLDRRCLVEKVEQGCIELRVHKASYEPDDEGRKRLTS